MTAKRVAVGLTVAVSIGVGLCAGVTAGGCNTTTSCTPEDYDLASATRLAVRELPGRARTPGKCEKERLDVVGSDADLRRLYEELGLLALPDGAPPEAGPIEYPAVDFGRERVIVREGAGNQAISWAVADGETGVLGLLSCGTPQAPSCVVNVIAVPAPIARAETRTCDPVGCGRPHPAPVPSLGAR